MGWDSDWADVMRCWWGAWSMLMKLVLILTGTWMTIQMEIERGMWCSKMQTMHVCPRHCHCWPWPSPLPLLDSSRFLSIPVNPCSCQSVLKSSCTNSIHNVNIFLSFNLLNFQFLMYLLGWSNKGLCGSPRELLWAQPAPRYCGDRNHPQTEYCKGIKYISDMYTLWICKGIATVNFPFLHNTVFPLVDRFHWDSWYPAVSVSSYSELRNFC